MEYDLSEIMIKAWEYRSSGLDQSQALKKAWKDIKTSKDMLLVLKKELEEQLKSVNYQLQHFEKEKTFNVASGQRDNIKVWGAVLTGLDKKYGFKREFKSYRYLTETSSKHAYYDYYIDAQEGDFIEVGEKSAYKNRKTFYHIISGKMEIISADEIIKHFQDGLNV